VTSAERKPPILFGDFDAPGVDTLDGYRAIGGYETAKEVLTGKIDPAEVIEKVKGSGLRGRGGAGFPAGVKWGFVPKDSPKPKYLVVNADESEPGTFKDRELMNRSPHRLIEGSILASYAINAHKAFIYVRGEFAWLTPTLWRAIDEAKVAGFLGASCFGSGYELDIVVHLGAGAYICGEETALLDSLEGKRGQPRVKPPFPAIEGLYGCPTVVNNVETIMNVPFIVKNGPDWYRQWGTEKSSGTKVFSISGMVNKPGNYEIEMGMPMSAFLEECAGGMREGYGLKAIIPGGSSVPWLPKEKIDTRLDFESLNEAGTFLGSGAAIVIDDGVCVVDALLNLIHFYRHESCGKCTPCREGGNWMQTILHRIENGEGSMNDVHDLKSIADQILGRSLCALGDAAAMPVQSVLSLYPDEFEYHVKEKRCLVNRRREAVESARKGEPILV
jgi:NADH-quinone oxidoreductase subunit F